MTTIEERRKAFKKALLDADLTAKQWAERRGITDRHLSRVLNGHWQSRRLTQAIDEFIESSTLVPA